MFFRIISISSMFGNFSIYLLGNQHSQGESGTSREKDQITEFAMDVVIFSADRSKFWNFIQHLTVSEVQTMEEL